MYVALFVVAVAAIIMFHEFGHFATAKAFGMKVEKFFLSFGPTLWSTRRGETEYGIKAIPAGGFVKIAGMNKFEEVDPADKGRLFYEQSAWKRVVVLVAGSATHFIVAFVLLWVALAFVGLPTVTTTVNDVLPGSPAADAGLTPGDGIVAIDGEPIDDWAQLQSSIQSRPGETVDLTVTRDGREVVLPVAVGSRDVDGEEQGFVGVEPRPVTERYGAVAGLQETISGEYSIGWLTGETLRGLAQVFNPAALGEFFETATTGAPRSAEDGGIISLVGAGQAINYAGQAGNMLGILLLLASLNIVLGVMNMLPLPPLDGGHVATLLVEEGVNGVRRARGRRDRWYLDPAHVTPIALAVILFFGVVGLTAIYVDIVNPISLQ